MAKREVKQIDKYIQDTRWNPIETEEEETKVSKKCTKAIMKAMKNSLASSVVLNPSNQLEEILSIEKLKELCDLQGITSMHSFDFDWVADQLGVAPMMTAVVDVDYDTDGDNEYIDSELRAILIVPTKEYGERTGLTLNALKALDVIKEADRRSTIVNIEDIIKHGCDEESEIPDVIKSFLDNMMQDCECNGDCDDCCR